MDHILLSRIISKIYVDGVLIDVFFFKLELIQSVFVDHNTDLQSNL